MRFEYTNGDNKDFIQLCNALDHSLNQAVGGEENRAQHIPFNSLSTIHDVIVVYDGYKPIGCASFKKYDDECAEVKRVYIQEEYRGRGISKILMEMLELSAREKGYTYFILETSELFVQAINLYQSIGYEMIENYGQYAGMSDSVCMKKTL